jgi:RHS repeat-associated protein
MDECVNLLYDGGSFEVIREGVIFMDGSGLDPVTGLYNYGYRDYQPEAARFTTVDPVRDRANWFVYVNNDPVNWVDSWGLSASDKQSKNTTDSKVENPKTIKWGDKRF